MFIHPTIMEHRIKEQQNDLLKFAQNERIIKGLKSLPSAEPGLIDRLYLRFAELLISFGMKIKERHRSMLDNYTEAYMHEQNT